MKDYKKIGLSIGSLVQEKNEAYGDSFGQACKILEVLYPDGIRPEQYRDALAISFSDCQTRKMLLVKALGKIFVDMLCWV